MFPTTADVVRASGISRSAVDQALRTMEDLGMIHRDGGHWKVTAAADLHALADRLWGYLRITKLKSAVIGGIEQCGKVSLDRFLSVNLNEADRSLRSRTGTILACPQTTTCSYGRPPKAPLVLSAGSSTLRSRPGCLWRKSILTYLFLASSPRLACLSSS